MRSFISVHPRAILHKNLIKNAIDDPRRAIFALQHNILMVERYKTFGNQEDEQALREFKWEELIKNNIPFNENLLLTKENLSREVSAYYRDYLARTKNSSNTIKRLNASIPPPSSELVLLTSYEVVNKIFRRILRILAGTAYSFVQHDNIEEAAIIFHDIEKIEASMMQRIFQSHKNFRECVEI